MSYKKGDKVIVAIEKMSNASRHRDMSIKNIGEWTFEGEVIVSGKKYVTVEFGRGVEKFEVNNNYLQKYTYGGADYKLYHSLEDVKNEREKEEIYDYLRSEFSSWHNRYLSLDTLRKIKDLIESDKI